MGRMDRVSDDEYPPKLANKEDWLAVYHDLEEYEAGWKMVEVMIGLVLEGRRQNNGYR